MGHKRDKNSLVVLKLEKDWTWAVVVAQLVERSLPILEVRGLDTVIGKTFILICWQLYCKDDNKEKEAGNEPFFKKSENEKNET